MKYFHVICEITPFQCKAYIEHAVISEDPLEFADRNRSRYNKLSHYGDHFQMIQCREISSKLYRRFKPLNPRHTESSALYFAKSDWSKFYADQYGM